MSVCLCVVKQKVCCSVCFVCPPVEQGAPPSLTHHLHYTHPVGVSVLPLTPEMCLLTLTPCSFNSLNVHFHAVI